MKAFVITIMDMPASMSAARRCINSVKNFPVEMWEATTPKDDPESIMESLGISTRYFDERGGSYRTNCMSAFLSHMGTWQWCIDNNEEVIVFEHDAVAVMDIPLHMNYQGCISLGAPSYGNFITPKVLGVNPLTSKRYFPGAHAYRLKPQAAQQLIYAATELSLAGPTDVFLNLDWFPWLEEYYPHPVEARDNFTTIQRVDGCRQKHNWSVDKYAILPAK